MAQSAFLASSMYLRMVFSLAFEMYLTSHVLPSKAKSGLPLPFPFSGRNSICFAWVSARVRVLSTDETSTLFEVVADYSYALDTLDNYDYQRLTIEKTTKEEPFLWFLNGNRILYRADGSKRIPDNTLVALTLMIAESRTEEKDVMVKVVVNLINQQN